MGSFEIDEDEFAKLIRKMNPPRVIIDNETCEKATTIKVDCVNKHGMLLQVVQLLTDLNLIIIKAYISSDGNWFMDVFNVTDQDGNKVWDKHVINHIVTTLESDVCFFPSDDESTFIELTGTDRPGLLSEMCAVLADKNCNVVKAELWTHNSRVAAVVHVSDDTTGRAIEDPERLSAIKELLFNVLKRDNDPRSAKTMVSTGRTHIERRLHQMMFDDRDYEDFRTHEIGDDDKTKPQITVVDCTEKGYTIVILRSKDRPKLLFDTVCTLTDMQYVVFHGTVSTGEDQAYQEYYIRHVDGFPVSSEAERQRVIKCLEAAITRRVSEGLELELRTDDKVGLLSDVTRIFRENGLTIKRAHISTEDGKALDTFYLSDTSGKPVEPATIESIQAQLGESLVRVKQNPVVPSKPPEVASVTGFLFGNLFKASFQSFRLVRSYT